MAGFLGLAAFVAVLFVVGAFMEGNARKGIVALAALAVITLSIALFTEPKALTDANCWIDWDGRTNATVCD